MRASRVVDSADHQNLSNNERREPKHDHQDDPRARLLGRPLYMRIPSPISTTSLGPGVPAAAQTHLIFQGKASLDRTPGAGARCGTGGVGLEVAFLPAPAPSGALESQMGGSESPAPRRPGLFGAVTPLLGGYAPKSPDRRGAWATPPVGFRCLARPALLARLLVHDASCDTRPARTGFPAVLWVGGMKPAAVKKRRSAS